MGLSEGGSGLLLCRTRRDSCNDRRGTREGCEMLDFRNRAIALVAAASVAGLVGAAPAGAQTTIKAVMHSDVKLLDPIWTTAYIQRNFGYMVWDTLFAVDDQFEVKPQMVDKSDVSADKLTWTFTLRDGLRRSNGTPGTSDDCIAS